MKVLVDTCVWSLALRRKVPVDPVEPIEVTDLRMLIHDSRVVMVGAVRQELLSGVKLGSVFEEIRGYLRGFPDLVLNSSDYELAASFYNRCRANGIQGSTTDFLLCAVAELRGLLIMTTDGDFDQYGKVLSIRRFVHQP